MMHGPLARYRLYGRTKDYATLAFNIAHKGEGSADPVRLLEAAAAQFHDVRHAIAMPQNRVGIYLAVKARDQDGPRPGVTGLARRPSPAIAGKIGASQ
jgi:hypothetical protein